jgi:hypothetical protein
MYDNCEVQVKAGKEESPAPYKTEVQQECNVAPVLFLFIMLAVSQMLWPFDIRNMVTILKKWRKSGRFLNQSH